jgi:hypothetical protein
VLEEFGNRGGTVCWSRSLRIGTEAQVLRWGSHRGRVDNVVVRSRDSDGL